MTFTPNWPTTKEPRWRLRDALAWLRHSGCPWHRRWAFTIRWILLRGRSVNVGTTTLTFNNQPTLKPLQWGIENVTIDGKKVPGIISATVKEVAPPEKLEWLRNPGKSAKG